MGDMLDSVRGHYEPIIERLASERDGLRTEVETLRYKLNALRDELGVVVRERDSAIASLARLRDVEARLDEADSERVAEAVAVLAYEYGCTPKEMKPHIASLVRAVLGLPEVGGG